MANHRKRFCLRGHDTKLTGRYSNNNCKQCRRELERGRKRQRSTARYCANGHDTLECGRYPSTGVCRDCQVLYNRNNRRPAGRVSALPIRRLIRDRGDCRRLYMVANGVTQRTAERAVFAVRKTHWITIETADQWCIALGIHLAHVHPELYTKQRAA